MERSGHARLLPDDVDTDQIIPGEYLNTIPEDQLGEHVLEGYDADFPERVADGDVLVAGKNFGLGSSREAAPIAIRNAGVAAVVAESFARIFYRNAINVGLPIAVVPGITEHVSEGDVVRVDLTEGRVENTTTGKSFSISPLPDDLTEILEAGGLVPLRQRQRTAEREAGRGAGRNEEGE
ncbi:LeuD/DmdB family oxidoreductase small subunit [Halocalculus aciditolerans]|uniref:3-isopropylmalate dehydratase small subunit n=1 Tax=Halocalculus aciditolerans TaxID=1383812 RepID=A0A830FLI3_9EURY|nr:3-isopropylmalate dehydratase [Halocalculus aciditolerans]GGL67453.1 3-isopropylmalate dehydratase small subunit [Halocalculus aciditolerans]